MSIQFQTNAFDVEVVDKLIGHWARQLDLPYVKSLDDDDATCNLGTVVDGLVGEKTLEDARLQLVIGRAIVCGAHIALAVVNEPLGDHRAALLDELEQLGAYLQRDAENARHDAIAVPA